MYVQDLNILKDQGTYRDLTCENSNMPSNIQFPVGDAEKFK